MKHSSPQPERETGNLFFQGNRFYKRNCQSAGMMRRDTIVIESGSSGHPVCFERLTALSEEKMFHLSTKSRRNKQKDIEIDLK